MSYEFQVSDQVVMVTVDGIWSRAESERALLEASRVAREQDASAVLLDLRQATIQLTEVDVYVTTTAMGDAFLPGTKHAVVIPWPEPTGMARFHQTVALNRGIRVKLFRSRAEAIDWLRSMGTARPEA